MSPPELIAGRGLGAIRGERVLFRDISVTANAGDLILLRGANGSGKTTLLRQLAGLSEAQSGTIERAGLHHWIGHTNGLKAHETPRSHLRHWARVWGSSAEVTPILNDMGMARPADVPCRMLSAGQKRRTALARLKLENRDLWLLDEPFNALDTEGQKLLAELIAAHRARGGAVIAALHGAAPIEPTSEVVL
ncbi:MAG: heme ABC exporter ATP-binding protein CcmA [Hyphomonadaceae bacterium]|nr:heme ABC exporter ATP-binding protein CcmA [Hyphomonadaceae bacterium]